MSLENYYRESGKLVQVRHQMTDIFAGIHIIPTWEQVHLQAAIRRGFR